MNTPIASNPGERLRKIASQFRYPPTPDVAGEVMKRLDNGSRPRARMRSAWLVTGLLILALAVLFAVPGVRAEIVRFFQVGVVRIFPAAATQTAIPATTQVPVSATPPAASLSTATPQNEPTSDMTLSGLAGETTLEVAQSSFPFPIRLPEYPANLGAPDRVFVQEDGPMVILVWTDPEDSRKVLLSLYEIGPDSVMIRKFQPRAIQETQVNGRYAVWAQGPYLVQLSDGSYAQRMLVTGNTLIWEEDKITYRLESDGTLEEALKIAESLK
jgi:hypothetical protein